MTLSIESIFCGLEIYGGGLQSDLAGAIYNLMLFNLNLIFLIFNFFSVSFSRFLKFFHFL